MYTHRAAPAAAEPTKSAAPETTPTEATQPAEAVSAEPQTQLSAEEARIEVNGLAVIVARRLQPCKMNVRQLIGCACGWVFASTEPGSRGRENRSGSSIFTEPLFVSLSSYRILVPLGLFDRRPH